MPVADVNGQSITYADSGGDGPAILWSHGFLMDHTMFDAQVEALADRYRCIAWDERGFGGTPATAPFTIQTSLPPIRSMRGTRSPHFLETREVQTSRGSVMWVSTSMTAWRAKMSVLMRYAPVRS